MSGRMYNTPFAALLPGSIATDPTIRAAAASLDGVLRSLTLSVPNLLLYSRLQATAGREPAFNMLPALERITKASGSLAPLSTAELELLAWQFHVDFREVARTDGELAGMVLHSIPWHRIKGTPAGIRQALGIFGISAEIQEFIVGRHWATYQLGMPEIADMDTVRRVTAIAKEMAPVRCRLGRLYNNIFDFRPAVWGVDKWAETWWSLYSGVHVPDMPGTDDDFIVSFGRKFSLVAESYGPSFGMGMASLLSCIAPYLDRAMWGHTPWGATLPGNHPFIFSQLYGSYFGDAYFDPPRIDRIRPAWVMDANAFSRSQAVTGEADKLWSDTACYGTRVVRHIDFPAAWGTAVWGDSQGLRTEVLHELTMRRSAGLAPVQPQQPYFGHTAHMAFRFTRHDVPLWGVTPWGAVQPANRPVVMASLHSGYFGQRNTRPRRWGGAWGGHWQIYVGLHRAMPTWRMGATAISRAQSVTGEAGKAWGQAAYGTRVERRIDAPQCWGAAAWGADQGLHYEIINELP